jgi:ribosomal protein L11 methyltransferase
VTIPCKRAQAESAPDPDELFPGGSPPVIVTEEPDETRPEDWLLHAYFEHEPKIEELATLKSLGTGDPAVEKLGEADWVTMSQSGLQPIRAGRFFVHTPMYRSSPPGTTAFEIDTGLAFGTGQHATTAGCLEALDKLERDGARFTNIADIGSGTGLLAFAALALWPDAKAIATDIDPIAVDVARDNAAINGIRLGHSTGELMLAEADGMDSPLIAARAPFDLVIANILAGPLIELAPAFAKSAAPGSTIVLAGLLDSQAEAVAAAYRDQDFSLKSRGVGEWPVLVCERPA